MFIDLEIMFVLNSKRVKQGVMIIVVIDSAELGAHKTETWTDSYLPQKIKK